MQEEQHRYIAARDMGVELGLDRRAADWLTVAIAAFEMLPLQDVTEIPFLLLFDFAQWLNDSLK